MKLIDPSSMPRLIAIVAHVAVVFTTDMFATPLCQEAYLKESAHGAGDQFGHIMAMSGNTLVVGAPFDDSAAVGIGGDELDDMLTNSGAVHVWLRDTSATSGTASWSEQAYIKASDPAMHDMFGNLVAIDGDVLVVGAPAKASRRGAVYVFRRTGTTWVEEQILTASNGEEQDFFGGAVAVSGDTIVVGAPVERSNATGINGNSADNSLADAGAAYVYQYDAGSGVWTESAYLKASDTAEMAHFGYAVGFSGDLLCVGAPDADWPGAANSRQGLVYLFEREFEGGEWTQEAKLKPTGGAMTNSGDFGSTVAVSGQTIAIGDPITQNGYIFTRQLSGWSEQARLAPPNPGIGDQYSTSVALQGDMVVFGAPGEESAARSVNGDESNNDASASGAAYVFARRGVTWTQTSYLKANNADSSDVFGSSVAISDGAVVVGAPSEASGTSNPGDNSSSDEGAVYAFAQSQVYSIAQKSLGAPGAVDIAFGDFGTAVISENGDAMCDTALFGAGAPVGKRRGVFSTLGHYTSTDLVVQAGDSLAGAIGLPTNAQVTGFNGLIFSYYLGVLHVTVSGTGVTAASNQVLLADDSEFLTPIFRTGQAISALGGAKLASIGNLIRTQDAHASTNALVVPYVLSHGKNPAVNATNDTGFLALSDDGSVISATAREGSTEFSTTGRLGQISNKLCQTIDVQPRTTTQAVYFVAKHIPPLGSPRDGLFSLAEDDVRSVSNSVIFQGDPAPTLTNGEKIGTILSVGVRPVRNAMSAFYHTTLTGAPASTNEAIFTSAGTIALRKGDAVVPGANISRIVRYWEHTQGVSGGRITDIVALVGLSGSGVTKANDQALISKTFGTAEVILRKGDIAEGCGQATLTSISAVEVSTSGSFVVLGTLSGPSDANQAIWSGNTANGNLPSQHHLLRRPVLRLRKGDLYTTPGTPLGKIRSLALKVTPDTSTAGNHGRPCSVTGGAFLACITGDRSSQELVRVTRP